MISFATGCAFSFKELAINFPLKSLSFKSKQCEEIINNTHKIRLVRHIFLFHFKLVIMDVILNNVTFKLPLVSNRKCSIHMQRYDGDTFKKLRKYGKWKDVDVLKSWFTGYDLCLYLGGERTPRVKNIYLNKEYRNIITENTNKGVAYGDGKTDTTIYTYLEDVYKQFPTISKKDINKILIFFWRSIYLHNSYGGDVFLKEGSLWCYMGNLKKNHMLHFFYYIKKLTVKLRVLYWRKNIKWDGYYYFALNQSRYELYKALHKPHSTKYKIYDYGNVDLFQLYDECKIVKYDCPYIFRIPYIDTFNFHKYVPSLKTNKAELIEIRKPLKFKDISVCKNEYDFI